MKKKYKILLFAVFLFNHSMLFGQVNWERIAYPFEGIVSSMAFSKSNPNIVFLAFHINSTTTLYKSTDAGMHWATSSSPSNINLSATLKIDPTNSNLVYSFNNSSNSFFKTINGGESWTEISSPNSLSIVDVDVASNGVLYCADFSDSFLFKSTNGGDSWEQIYNNSGNANIEKIYCSSNDNNLIYLITGYKILKSTDGGNNFTTAYEFSDFQFPYPKLYLDPVNNNNVYVETKDFVLKTLDGFQTTSSLNDIRILTVDNNSNIYKTSSFGLFISNDYGATWSQVSNSGLLSLDLLTINPLNSQTMFANANNKFGHFDGAGLLISKDGGASWFQMTIIEEESEYLQDLTISYSDEYIFAKTNGYIFRTKNFNTIWELVAVPNDVYGETFMINYFDKNYQIMLNNETTFVTKDGGTTWNEKLAIPDEDWNHAIMSPKNPSVIFAWKSGSYQLFRTQNMCDTWETISLPQGNIQSVNLSSNNSSVVFLKDNDILYKSDNMGTSWTKISFPESMPSPKEPFVPLSSIDTQFYFGNNRVNPQSYIYSVMKSSNNSENFTINSCNFSESRDYPIDVVEFNPSTERVMFGLINRRLIVSNNSGIDWQFLNNPLGVGNGIENIYYKPSSNYDTLIVNTQNGVFKGDVSTIVSIDDDIQMIFPTQTKLFGNYPNPFNPTTTIDYQVSSSGSVKILIYNMNGQLVQTLNEGLKTQGSYSTKWFIKNLSSGIYFYQLTINENIFDTKKAIYLK